MIRLSDTVILAGTKLRTHRIRTIITVALSSVLFAALIAASIMGQGASKSLTTFNNQGLNGKYIVAATPDSPLAGDVLASEELLDLANQKQAELITAKTVEAKKLGIAYDPTTEIPAVFTQTIPGQGSSSHLSLQSYAAQEAVNEYVTDHPAPGMAQLEQIASPYHPVGVYTSELSTISSGNVLSMPNGQENFAPQGQTTSAVDFFQTARLEVDSPQLTKPFMLSGVKFENTTIPIIVSYSTASKLLGLPTLSSSASAQAQSDRIQELYTKAGSTVIDACYRNSVSQDQISQAISQAADIAKNVNNKTYVKPTLIYGLPPANSCGQAIILSDTRTTAEKSTQVAQDTFDATFGQVVSPVAQKFTFQIVGLSPDPSAASSTTFKGLVAGIVGSSLDGGATVIPSDLLSKMPNESIVKSILFPQSTNSFGASVPTYYVEFSTASDARHFITNESCTTRADGTCATVTRLFNIVPQDNDSIALQDLQQKITNTLLIATVVVAVLAIVIMTSLVGRTISDGRRETAVFRALGANRGDIAAIYTLYTFYLTALIALISFVLGIGGAYIINKLYTDQVTLQARLLFDSVHTNLIFSFFSINVLFLGGIVAIILITGLLGIVVPLLRNIPRSPIKDMRQE